jgi:hypothetical protein
MEDKLDKLSEAIISICKNAKGKAATRKKTSSKRVNWKG